MSISPYKIPYLAFLLLSLWTTCGLSNADPEPVKTIRQTLPLHFVSWIKGGPIVPEIAIRINNLTYAASPQPKQFLDAPANSPEQLVARYLQVLSDGKGTLTPETLNAAKNLYSPDERNDKDKDADIEKLIAHDYSRFNQHPDTFLLHRFDVGPLTIISLAYNSRIGMLPTLTCDLRKIGSSYFLSTYENISVGQGYDPLLAMINVTESNLVVIRNLADVPQPKYQYHFLLPTSAPGDASAPNPVEMLFNGTLSNALVDEKMVPADATQAFVKRAILTERSGNLQQFLALWTDDDQKGILARRMALDPGGIPISRLGSVSTVGQSRIVFTIDCGVESLVFLRVSYSKQLQMLVVWKKAPDDYRLSEAYDVETQDPKVHETPITSELERLFSSPVFQTYVNDKVDQFIKANPH